MSLTTQRAYLDALEIPVWVRTELVGQVPDFEPPGLKLSPGSSQVLLVCSGIDEPAKRIAADIVRCLNAEPVWAWPAPGSEHLKLEEQVNESLYTNILLFGSDLATQLFNGVVPETLGSARVTKAASLQELEASSVARQELWKTINECAIVGSTTIRPR